MATEYYITNKQLGAELLRLKCDLPYIAYPSWLKSLWNDYGQSDWLPLKHHEEMILWELAIKRSSISGLIVNNWSMASKMMDAYEISQHFELDIEAICGSLEVDNKSFLEVSSIFLKSLKGIKRFSFSEIEHRLIHRLDSKNQLLTIHLKLEGNQHPSQAALFSKMSSLGHKIVTTKDKKVNDKALRFSFENRAEELKAATKWLIETHTLYPNDSVALVIPNLRMDYTNTMSIVRGVRANTQATLEIGGNSHVNSVFDTAIGDAFEQIVMSPVHKRCIYDWSSLFRSPFMDFGISASERAFLSEKLIAKGWDKLSISRLHLLDKEKLMPIFHEKIERWMSTQNQHALKPSEWVSQWLCELESVGWPGQATRHHQIQLSALEELLFEFSELDSLLDRLSRYDAVQILKRMAHSVHVEDFTHSNVYVIDIEEYEHVHFDHVWISGVSSGNWPGAVKPNPFIPFDIGNKKSIPNFSNELELERYIELTDRALSRHKTTIFSYHHFHEGQELLPSQIIKDVPLRSNRLSSGPENMIAISDLEVVEDGRCRGIKKGEHVKGGTGLLKAIANCPFQAIARYRFEIVDKQQPQIGLSLADRGVIFHRVLEAFWNQTKSQASLLKMDSESLRSKLLVCIRKAINEFRTDYPVELPEAYFNIETNRLLAICLRWMDIEKERSAFTVKTTESKSVIKLASLFLAVAIDRIDLDENGKPILIDYKSGLKKPNQWAGDRPEEPQLPLYTLSSKETPVGVVFGTLKPNKLGFNGFSTRSKMFPNVKVLGADKYLKLPSTIDAIIKEWEIVLTSLANDFSSGDAKVAPSRGNSSCEYCQFKSACRNFEMNQ